MKKLLFTLIILATILTGCDLAEAQLTEAQTEQANEQADAEATAELLRIVNRLTDQLAAQNTALIDTIKAQESGPMYTALSIALLVAAVGVLAYFQERRRRDERREDMIMLAQLVAGNGRAQQRLGQRSYIVPTVDVEVIQQEVERWRE